jgi:uncharacterized DUF497 family protein
MSIHIVYTDFGEFEWDQAKRLRNLLKHRLDFIDGINIFRDSVLEREDNRKNYGEARFVALGKTTGEVLNVVYTMCGQAKRIISVRKVNRNEKKTYRIYCQTIECALEDGLEICPEDER